MTLSKETLEEIAELARKATYKPCAMHITNLVARCDSEVVEELIRELLERRELDKQEPVAMRWRWINGDEGPGAWWYHDTQHFEELKKCGDRECELVYAAPLAPVVPKILPCPVLLEPGIRFGKGVPTQTMLGALQRRAEYYAELEAMTPEQRAEHDAGIKEFAAMLQSFGNSEQLNSPAIPDDWIKCSERMPEPNKDVQLFCSDTREQFVGFRKGVSKDFQYAKYEDVDITCEPTHWQPLPAAPKQESE